MDRLNDSECLYHYTSIDILALILKYHTIRLNPLNKLDDLQEQKTADIENLGKFVFVSSWTSDEKESIPMWKMYTNPLSGVRIKLHKNPFVRNNTYLKDIEAKTGMKADIEFDHSEKADTFLDLSELMSKGYYSPQAWGGDILKEIQYTDDQSLLEPKVSETTDSNIIIDIGKLGIYKSKYWEFQKEWRYIMSFIPLDFKGGPEGISQSINLTAQKILLGIENPPFKYYDLTIDSEFYSKMEITCSPKITAGNRIILKDLVEKYNKTAIIRESELYGKL